MKEKRSFLGSEATEIALTSGILLVLAVGAVTIFSGNLQKVFQNADSPVMVSAGMKNSANAADPNAANSRTSLDRNLVTSNFISKTHSDLSLGTAVGLETTGTAGGDSEIGGTYLVENPDALYDGDPSTTGNALLDAALAAKKSAMSLYNESTSYVNQANIFNSQANKLNKKAQDEQTALNSIKSTLTELAEECTTVNNHLNLLGSLKLAAEGIAIDIATALKETNDANTRIVNETNTRMVSGQGLLNLNQQQIAAYNTYQSLESSYNAGWNTCDDGMGNTYACNTSGISTNQINSALNQSNLLLSQVNGQAAGLSNSVGSLNPSIQSLEQQAKDARENAKDLMEKSKDTLKNAFYDSHLFDNCSSVQDIIDKAFWALGKGGKGVKNKEAAENAIKLLVQSSKAYKSAKELEAKAQEKKDNLDDLQKTLTQLAQDALNISLNKNLVDKTAILQTQTAQATALLQSDPNIQMVSNELTKVQSATLKATDQLTQQEQYVNELLKQSVEASNSAKDLVDQSTVLKGDAKLALTKAEDTIDSIVKYPNET